ncbi:MAG TPA: fructose 1,6-bisphosphatase [bacterium]|nr:fructose 1,6-bisphosphatase [bacterium]
MAGSTGRAPITITAIKADVGSIAGHTQPSPEMLKVASEMAGAQRGKLLVDCRVTHTGDDICVLMTHRHGVEAEAVHRLAYDIFMEAGSVAERQGLYGAKQDILKSEFSGNIQGMGPGVAEVEIVERPAEPFMVLTADKTEPGAFNLLLYLTFCDPMYCGGLLLSPDVGKGFTFTVVDVNHTEAEREITLKAPEDLYDLAALLRDTGRFVVKSIHSRAHPNEQAVALSTTRLKHIAGRYVGKDDPVAIVRTQKIFPATEEFGLAFSKIPYVAGDCRGSHNMPLAPVPLNTDSSIFYCLPMVSAAGYSIRDGVLTGPIDLFKNPVWEVFLEQAVRKGAEIRSQGFFNPAMLGMEELEYGGIMERLKALDQRFVLNGARDGDRNQAAASAVRKSQKR